MTCDTPKPWRFPFLDSCRKRFLWTSKEVDLAPHSVVGLVLHVGEPEMFLPALGFKSLDPFFSESASRVHDSQPWRRMEVTRDLYNWNLLAKLTVLLRQVLFNLAVAAVAEAILMRMSAE